MPAATRRPGHGHAAALAAAAVLLTGCATTVNGSATQAAKIGASAPSAPTPSGRSPVTLTGEPGSTLSAPDTDPSAIRTTVITERTTTGQTAATDLPTGSTASDTSRTSAGPSSAQPATTARTKWKLPAMKPNRPTNKFGDIAAVPGESYGIVFGPEDSGHQLVFMVSKIGVDPKCAKPGVKPAHGHFVRIDISIEPRNLTQDDLDRFTASFGASGWTAFDADGTAQVGIDSDPAQECLPKSRVPYLNDDQLVDAGVVTGTVVLDVAGKKGTALLDLGLSDGGWEYHYG